MTTINRAEFVLLFDVKDGNPNGDPDAGNPNYGNNPYQDNQLAGYDSMNTDEQL